MSNIDKQAIDFSQPIETESGEPVKYVCQDVVEYKCARICVDVETGIVYSSPYAGLKIRNTPLRKIIENATSAYADFENGFISDTACMERSHEYLLFVKEPKNVLALLDELEAKDNRINRLEAIVAVAEQRNALMREWKRALKVPCDLVDDQVPVVIHGMVIRLESLKETEAKLEDAEKQIADLKEAFRIALSAAGIDAPAAVGKGE